MFMYMAIVPLLHSTCIWIQHDFCYFQQHVTRKETYATEILQIIRLRGKLQVSLIN